MQSPARHLARVRSVASRVPRVRKGGEQVADFAIRLATGTPIDQLTDVKPVDLVYRGSVAAPASG